MSRFLFTAWPFAGHFYPTVAIAHALKARGHHCAYYTGEGAGRVISDEGFAWFPFRRVDEQDVRATMLSGQSGGSPARDLMSMRGRLRKWLVDTIPGQLDDLGPVLDEFAPDAVVCDPTMWAPMVVLHEKYRIPVVVASFVPGCMIPGPDAPPFGLGLPAPRTRVTRLLSRAATAANAVFATKVRRGVNAIRRQHGLPEVREAMTAFMGRMPLYLVPSVPQFDFNRSDLPPSVRYVGPYLWNKPRQFDSPAWLAKVPRHRPWVHVTEGTFHGGDPFVLRAAMEGLADAPVEVVITTGGDRDPQELGLPRPAANMHITRWISHADLLPATDVVVTTGGAGTVLAALSAGRPLVVIPTEFDKPDNARRVVEAGAGVIVSPRACTPARLRDAVLRLVDDPSYRRNAERMAAALASAGGPARAADLIEELVPGGVRAADALHGVA